MPDEVEGEDVPEAGVLLCEGLGRVLADQPDSGLGQRAHLLNRDVFRGREQLDLPGPPPSARAGGLDPLLHREQVLAHALGLERRPCLYASHARPACRPVTPWSRRWEKKWLGLHDVHISTSWTRSAATPAHSSSARTAFGRSSRFPSVTESSCPRSRKTVATSGPTV